MLTPKNSQLKNLAGAMPIANQKAADAAEQARVTRLQQAVGQITAPGPGVTPPGPGGIQQMAAQQVAQQGQNQIQAQANLGKQAQALGQMALAEDKQAKQVELQQKHRTLMATQRNNQDRLFRVSEEGKRALFDNQMTFRKDDLGRTLFNERQLADWAILKAKNSEELANYEQMVTQASQRRMTLLKAAEAKIRQELQQIEMKSEQELDQGLKQRLYLAKAKLEEKLRREKAEAASRAAMWQAGGTILGIGAAALGAAAVVGTGGAALPIVLAAAGAGGAVGGGLGASAGAATASKD